MATSPLPKRAHPDFLTPGIAPKGEVDVDLNHRHAGNLRLCIIGNKDIVSQTLLDKELVEISNDDQAVWYQGLGSEIIITLPEEIVGYTFVAYVKSFGWDGAGFENYFQARDSASNIAFRIRSTPTGGAPIDCAIAHIGFSISSNTTNEDDVVAWACRADTESGTVYTRAIDAPSAWSSSSNIPRNVNDIHIRNDVSAEIGHVAFFLFDRYMSEEEVEEFLKDPYDIVQPAVPMRSTIAGGGGAQSIAPTLITEHEVLFSLTALAGGVSVAPTLITENGVLFNVTPDPSISITPGLITENGVLFSATPDPGNIGIVPALITENGVLFSVDPATSIAIVPTLITENGVLFDVTPDATVSIAPSLITENGVLFAVTPDAGAVGIVPTLITENGVLFNVTPDATVSIAPSLITENGVLFTVTPDAGAVGVVPTLITENGVLFSVTPTTTVNIAPTLITENGVLFNVTPDPGNIDVIPALITENGTLFDIDPLQGGIVSVDLIIENGILFNATPDPGNVSAVPALITENGILFSVTPDSAIAISPGLITENGLLFSLGIDLLLPVGLITENGILFDASPANNDQSIVPGLITEHGVLFAISSVVVNRSATVLGIVGGQNLTNLSYLVLAGYDIGATSIIKQGSMIEDTNANGDLVIDLNGTSVSDGDPLRIIIADNTALPTAANRAAVCHTTALVV